MRRALYIIAAVAVMVAGTGQAATTKTEVSRVAAGRIRFIEGTGGDMTFQGKTVAPDLDFLVLVGAAFRTNQSRLELQTLNGDLFWFDRDTDFHFEASDPAGGQTTLFLGKGSFVVRTDAPFALITGAGSVLLPAHGTYSVSKDEFGKQRLTVGRVSGPLPTVIKQSTLFSKIVIGKKVNQELVAWTHQREENWERTLGRANMFSNVDKMQPMLAYTDEAGKLRWRRVSTVRPLAWANGFVRDNFFTGAPWYYNLAYLRTTGFLPGVFIGWSDFQINLWFRTSWYNSLKWAWDVPHGWHAEWYWDPLGGFGAEFGMASWPWGLCPYWGSCDWGYWGYWNRGADWDWRDHEWRDRRHWCPPLAAAPDAPRPVLRGRIARAMGRPTVVRLAEHSRVSDRLHTDPGLRSIRQARHLDIRPADIHRAMVRRAFRRVSSPDWFGRSPRSFSAWEGSGNTTATAARRASGVSRPSSGGGRVARGGK